MRLAGRVCVVTGGGSGIGAALARRFRAEEARGVVIADRDAEAAERVAAEVEGLAVPTDVTDEAQVRRLVERSEERFGPVGLFCANAGAALGAGTGGRTGGPFVPDAVWRESFELHVMAHVYAARAVLPGMLERGEGALLHTASAAGLLADLGTQPYSVTKHATVAFAEWLAIAYGDAGLYVACLCPQGVRTPMLEGAAAAGLGEHLAPDAIEPEAVADAVVEGLEQERFLILPHPQVRDYLRRKGEDPERWLGGMRRLRRRLYGETS